MLESIGAEYRRALRDTQGLVIAESVRSAQNAPVDSLMTQARKSRGLSLEGVACQVGTDQANLSRIEKGAQIPKRDLARRLFAFYSGEVPLGAIYDPEFAPAAIDEKAA